MEPGIHPDQLTFGKLSLPGDYVPGKIILTKRSPTLYEWENPPHRIRVEQVGERWQGTMVVQRCNFPMSSLCSDPQEAANTLQAGFLGFYNCMKDIRLRNRAESITTTVMEISGDFG